jgi:hypothetical protein
MMERTKKGVEEREKSGKILDRSFGVPLESLI